MDECKMESTEECKTTSLVVEPRENRGENRGETRENRGETNYNDGLKYQVEVLKMKDPMKYQKYQDIGNSLMSLSYNLDIGRDDEGDQIKAKKLLYTVRDYGIEEDLSKEEIMLLTRVYGEDWRKELTDL